MDQKSNESNTESIAAKPQKITKYYYERLLTEAFRKSWYQNKLEKFNNQEDVKYDNYLKNYAKNQKLIFAVGVVGTVCFDFFVCVPRNLDSRTRFRCALIGICATIIANNRLQKPWKRYAYELEMGKIYEKQLRENNPNLELAFQNIKEEHNAFIKEAKGNQQTKEDSIEIATKTDETS
ncbi:unnamed protein product [Blepharisma stoltei]|uniref:Transmembrane protein n=1 Tax=Blepharisma stoltei TaxID=1481888 RepID=A0AAU9IY31_9CILI|nr:unnamed protein product [Blepharisma stoltei]